MKKFTNEDLRKFDPCYDPIKYLKDDETNTILTILDHEKIPFEDKLWVILRTDYLSERIMRLFAVWCARQVQHLMTDKRSTDALDVAEAFANGLASKEELDAARAAARAAARDAARAAARDAAWDAAWDAAGDAALDAARSAAWAAALDAAGDAAWAAALDAARDAARDAATAAATAAARDAAWGPARDAATAAARDAAWDAATAAARDAQKNKLREMIIAGIETGDVVMNPASNGTTKTSNNC